MIRTVISIDDDIKQWLDHRAIQQGVSMTALVRQALQLLREQEEHSVNRVLRKTSGIWTSGDGLDYQETMREEWEKR